MKIQIQISPPSTNKQQETQMQELPAKAKDEIKLHKKVFESIKESKWGEHLVNICESKIF